MQDVTIIDQAVPRSIQDLLEDIALGSKVNWYRQKGATYEGDAPKIFPVTPDSLEVHQFTHTIYEDKQPVSQLFTAILPVITAIPHTIKQLVRIKLNLSVFAHTEIQDPHGMPHVDFTKVPEPLLSAIYYINDSTGDTVIFNQKFGQSGPLTVKTRVAPKKGRLVVFDGALLHAGNTPRTNEPRAVLNFDAFVYEGAQATQPAPAA